MGTDENPDVVRVEERLSALTKRVDSMDEKMKGLESKAWQIIILGITWVVAQLLDLIPGGKP